VLDADPYHRGGPPQMACQNCGECFIGCNTHSKNTMDLTYLWHADRASAEVFSQHPVSRIKPNPGIIQFARTATRSTIGTSVGIFPGMVCANKVIVSAGRMGSTELLLRNKASSRTLKQAFQWSSPCRPFPSLFVLITAGLYASGRNQRELWAADPKADC